MISGTKGLFRVIVDVALLVPIACLGIIAYWAFVNAFFPVADFVNPVANKDHYTAGEIMFVKYFAIRHRSCTLEISRIIERVADNREYQMQHIVQYVPADHPPFKRSLDYRVQVPVELATGDYDVFSRIRYFCNGLDYVVSRHVLTPKIRIHVTGIV